MEVTPDLRVSDSAGTSPSGVLTISSADLAVLLQSRASEGWWSDHAGAVIAALIGAVMMVMTAFMHYGFNDLKTDIAELSADLKTDIAELRAELKADIEEVKADVDEVKADVDGLRVELADVRGDISEIDKRFSVLIGILNLRSDAENAVQGQLTTPATTLQP